MFATAAAGRYLRGDSFWPEVLGAVCMGVVLYLVSRWKRGGSLEDRMRRASSAVRENLNEDTSYVLIMAEWDGSVLASNLDADNVHRMLKLAMENMHIPGEEVH